MKLLKIGDRYINPALVTDIRDSEGTITVFFAGGISPNLRNMSENNVSEGVRALAFEGEEADMLRRWLGTSANAEDLGRRLSQGTGLYQGSAKRQD